jgi:uncharacterized protein
LLKLCLSLVLLPALPAADWSRLRPQGHVSDFASVLPAASRQKIEQYLATLENASGAQVAIVTIASLEGDPIEDVANSLYRSFGIGKKDTNEGALFLLAIQERRSRLEVGYGLEAILPDAAAGEILRAMRPALRQGQYGLALETAAHSIGARIATARQVSLPAIPAPPAAPGEEIPLPMLLLLLGALALFALYNRRRSPYRAFRSPWIFPSGGGFGGASSSGGASWGGFGGGDSGGGGASSDW